MIANINNLFIFLLSLYSVLWGTGWNIKYINLNISEFFFPIIFLYILFLSIFKISDEIKTNNIFIIFIFFLLIFIYSLLGYLNIINLSNSFDDKLYMIEYVIKLSLFFIFANCISFIIKNENDLRKFVTFFLIIFIPLYFYLHYRYIYIYNTFHTGVSLDGEGLKNNKNSFGGMIALIYPFVLANILSKPHRNLFYFLGMITILISTTYLYSRSMVVAVIISTILMILLNGMRRKNILFFVFLVLISIVSFNNYEEDFKKYFYKSAYVDSNTLDVFEFERDLPRGQNYLISDTHRGWLLHESIIGAKNNYYLGNGFGTFRIRSTNFGSKTESHNDFGLIIYETGLPGLILFLILIFTLIYKSYLQNKQKQNIYLKASIVSLSVLLVLMMFTNFINTFMFWLFIGINLSILQYSRRV